MKPFDGLLAWYRPRRRAYPWRRSNPDPYVVLVSEVMLQQTQAARVAPAFGRFVATFPDVEALAAAPVADVIRAWTGLGYNRRAVALSRAARAIVRDHGGRIPDDPADLERLPGVGPYTAAAVASLAYGRPLPAIDTNVRRVVSRAFLGAEPTGAEPAVIRAAAAAAIDRRDPASWNQAVMDLGREICRPVPRCDRCPISRGCRFVQSGLQPAAPVRRQSTFEGSFRQVRGRIVSMLRSGPRTVSELEAGGGGSAERTRDAITALEAESLVELTPGGGEGASMLVSLVEERTLAAATRQMSPPPRPSGSP